MKLYFIKGLNNKLQMNVLSQSVTKRVNARQNFDDHPITFVFDLLPRLNKPLQVKWRSKARYFFSGSSNVICIKMTANLQPV